MDNLTVILDDLDDFFGVEAPELEPNQLTGKIAARFTAKEIEHAFNLLIAGEKCFRPTEDLNEAVLVMRWAEGGEPRFEIYPGRNHVTVRSWQEWESHDYDPESDGNASASGYYEEFASVTTEYKENKEFSAALARSMSLAALCSLRDELPQKDSLVTIRDNMQVTIQQVDYSANEGERPVTYFAIDKEGKEYEFGVSEIDEFHQ